MAAACRLRVRKGKEAYFRSVFRQKEIALKKNKKMRYFNLTLIFLIYSGINKTNTTKNK